MYVTSFRCELSSRDELVISIVKDKVVFTIESNGELYETVHLSIGKVRQLVDELAELVLDYDRRDDLKIILGEL